MNYWRMLKKALFTALSAFLAAILEEMASAYPKTGAA